MKQVGNYIISGGTDGKSRLNVLSEVLYPYTRSLLQAAGLASGMSFLDVGCGGGNVALMAADMVGSAGSITAVDFDEDIIALNRQTAADMQNVDFRAMSVYDVDFEEQYNMVYARFLLSHLTEPQRVLDNMLRSAKAGGSIVVEDVQFSGHFCHPACPAFDQYVQLYSTAAIQRGQDPEIGARLLSLFNAAGVSNTQVDMIQPTFNKGVGKGMAWITMDRIKEAVKAQGLANTETVDEILVALKTFTNDEATIMSMPRIFRVWGIKA